MCLHKYANFNGKIPGHCHTSLGMFFNRSNANGHTQSKRQTCPIPVTYFIPLAYNTHFWD